MSEATARIRINRLLEEAGWRFFDEDDGPANVRLEAGVKLKPADLDALGDDFEHAKNGRVDFLLLDGRGRPFVVLEAKRERLNPLTGKEQARRYARSLDCRFVILSNGNLHYFWDLERGNPHVVAAFPKPDAVAEYERRDPPDRGRLAAEPVDADYIALTQRPGYASEAAWRNEAERAEFVRARGLRFLRPYQTDAIHALQRAARDGADRFLFEMATGTGKTLTAAAAIKLFLNTGAARRALFLVEYRTSKARVCVTVGQVTLCRPSGRIRVSGRPRARGPAHGCRRLVSPRRRRPPNHERVNMDRLILKKNLAARFSKVLSVWAALVKRLRPHEAMTHDWRIGIHPRILTPVIIKDGDDIPMEKGSVFKIVCLLEDDDISQAVVDETSFFGYGRNFPTRTGGRSPQRPIYLRSNIGEWLCWADVIRENFVYDGFRETTFQMELIDFNTRLREKRRVKINWAAVSAVAGVIIVAAPGVVAGLIRGAPIGVLAEAAMLFTASAFASYMEEMCTPLPEKKDRVLAAFPFRMLVGTNAPRGIVRGGYMSDWASYARWLKRAGWGMLIGLGLATVQWTSITNALARLAE